MTTILRFLSSLILFAALVGFGTEASAADAPDIWKELGERAKEELSSEIRSTGRRAVNQAKYQARKAIRSGITKSNSGSNKGKKKVKIKKFPETVDEFVAMCEEQNMTPEGAVAMQVVALAMCSEIDLATGLECMELINTPTGLTSHARDRLREWYGEGSNDPRPYQAAAFFQGAKPDNGYNPKRPLTVEVYVMEETEEEDYDLVTVRLAYTGSESSKDIRITLMRPDDEDYYYIHSNNSMYVKVKKKKRGTTYNGLR